MSSLRQTVGVRQITFCLFFENPPKMTGFSLILHAEFTPSYSTAVIFYKKLVLTRTHQEVKLIQRIKNTGLLRYHQDGEIHNDLFTCRETCNLQGALFDQNAKIMDRLQVSPCNPYVGSNGAGTPFHRCVALTECTVKVIVTMLPFKVKF